MTVEAKRVKYEEINSQRITNLESDLKEVRKDVAQLMRELPHIVQDAVGQALDHVKGNNGNSNGKNSNGSLSWSAVGLVVTLIFSVGAMLQQQIVFLGGIMDANRLKIEKQSDFVVEERKWMLNHIEREINSSERNIEKQINFFVQKLQDVEAWQKTNMVINKSSEGSI